MAGYYRGRIFRSVSLTLRRATSEPSMVGIEVVGLTSKSATCSDWSSRFELDPARPIRCPASVMHQNKLDVSGMKARKWHFLGKITFAKYDIKHWQCHFLTMYQFSWKPRWLGLRILFTELRLVHLPLRFWLFYGSTHGFSKSDGVLFSIKNMTRGD